MPRPLLPPRGIFVPTLLAYHRNIPPAALHTWMQLRGLAWGKPETPALNMQEVSELTGKSPATLYGHMALLRNKGALRWRSSGTRTFIVTFDVLNPDQEPDLVPGLDTDSKNLEKPSLLTPPDHQNLNIEEKEREGAFQKSGKLFQKSGESGENHSSSSSQLPNPQSPITFYQSSTSLRPNQAQRKEILAAVTDLALWQATLEHWQVHRWSPKNIPGLLDLYRRGGPSACLYCQKAAGDTQGGQRHPTLEIIDQMRKELNHGRDRTNPRRS